MGFQLWISPNTGIRRKGTTFREIQDIFINNITTRFIYEPLYCCRSQDHALEVKETLEKRGFDVIGVMNENNEVIGFALRADLRDSLIQDFTHRIESINIIDDSTPILKLLTILSKNSFSLVIESNKIAGIVTRADINKPIVRIYIFGIISLFELHLNFWISEYHGDSLWLSLISEQRINETIKIYKQRKGKNEDLTLLECAQLCDKKEILRKTDEFRTQFNFSKGNFKSLLEDVEKIRNELAHSQNSIIANLEWSRFVETVSSIESFLEKSEKIVEEKARTNTSLDNGKSG